MVWALRAGVKYWVVAGGTGRFEGASGVMSGACAWAGSPFVGFGTGQFRVRAELWEDWLPLEPDSPPNPDVEYLAVPCFEGFLSSDSTVESSEECDRSDPDVVVCETTTSGMLRATLLGDATESATGTWTQLLTETRELDDGSTAIPILSESEGTITSNTGDELHFVARTKADPCATLGPGSFIPAFHWRVTGGTGRFDGAGGVMTGLGAAEFGGDTGSIQIGRLHLRSDLWEDLIPWPD